MGGPNYPVRQQGPTSNLDYSIDWRPFLPSTVHLATSVWAADPVDGTAPIVFSNGSHASDVALSFITGGVVGRDYLVTNTIMTTATPPVTDSRSFLLQVREVMAEPSA